MKQVNEARAFYKLAVAIFLMGSCSLVSAQVRYGPIKSGETIYSILADRVSRDELNLRQWALATLALNPDAFGDNVGQLRLGSTLLLPTAIQAKNQWRRGLAIETGQVSASIDADTAVTSKTVDATETPTPVSQSEWSEKTPIPAGNGPNGPLVGRSELESSRQKIAASAESDTPTLIDNTFRTDPAYSEIMRQVGQAPSSALLDQMETLEAAYAGDPDFDYAYGVVLLDAGLAQEALFPLLRASQARPKSLGVWLDLGRAYFEADDNESARVIFDALKQQSPPPAAAEVIESYQRAILRRSSRYKPTWVTAIGLEAGYDTNANSATELRQFIGFSLDEQARSAESAFAELRVNTQYAKPLAPRWRWLFSGQARYRENFEAELVNALQAGVSTGLSYQRGGWQLSARLGGDTLRIDGEENATSVGLSGGWLWNWSPFTRLQANGRIGSLRYVDTLSVRDVDQWLLAVGVNQRGQFALGSEIALKLIGGQDEAVESGSPYGRNVIGSGADFTVQISPRVRWVGNLQWLSSDYDGLFFGLPRQDEQWSTVMALELSDNRFENWLLVPSVKYVDNSSDVALYAFDRVQASLALSHNFD